MNAISSILVLNETDVRIIWQISRVRAFSPQKYSLLSILFIWEIRPISFKEICNLIETGSAMSSTQLACADALLWSVCECAATYQRMWSECLFPACCSNLSADCSLGLLMCHVCFSKWPSMLPAEDYVIYEELGMQTKKRIVGFRGREEINFQDAGLFVCVSASLNVMQSGTCYSWLSVFLKCLALFPDEYV